MTITRPYGASDNMTNKTALGILCRWAEKNGEKIREAQILEAAVIIETETGRNVRVIKADGSTNKNIRNYLSMYEEIRGKRVRIKKTEW